MSYHQTAAVPPRRLADAKVMTVADQPRETQACFNIEPSRQRRSAAERRELMRHPGFGRVFSDHMATVHYSRADGWHDARISAFAPLPLSPAAMAIHYGQSIYEGLKAYRHPSGAIAVFRPHDNARRFNRSARRMAMPELPEEFFVGAVEEIVRIDREWVPTGSGRALYLRPFMFATEAGLGVRPANEYLFVVIAGPVEPFFAAEPNPVTVWLSDEYVRAAPGGTGEAKCAGNYAASLLAQAQAAEKGCDQVVWLDALGHRYVEEMGGMNVFVVRRDPAGGVRLVTPALTGTLLAGVTRDSIISLGRSLGYQVEERLVTVDEWRKGAADGSVTEAFACGTAAVVTPIGEVRSAQGDFRIGDGQPGDVTLGLRSALLAIQEGTAIDSFGWMHEACGIAFS